MDGLPEGIYIDKEAISKETERITNVVLNEIVEGISDQTAVVAAVDEKYAAQNIPMFIREQAAYRLGEILASITVVPIMERMQDILRDKPREY